MGQEHRNVKWWTSWTRWGFHTQTCGTLYQVFAGFLIAVCAWTCLDSTDRQITVNLHPCSSIFHLFHPSSDLKGMGGGRNDCVVCSCSQLHILSQTVFLVMETFLLMCHNSRCKTSPMLCSAANKAHWGSSQTEQKLQDHLLLDSSYRGCVLSSQQLFFMGERPIFGLSFDIMYTFLLPDAPLWFAVCVLPLAMWLNGLLSSSSAPLPSINTQIYRLCQPQSPFSWWGPLAVGEKATTW